MLTRLMFPYSLARAARIAAASQATARDLQDRYRVPVAKIEVVYAAAGEDFRPGGDRARLKTVREQYGASAGYVLHFSTGDPRDNTAAALAAFARARLPDSKKLIVAGVPQPQRGTLEKVIAEQSLGGRVILTGFQTGQALVELYQAADAYLDPSLYEGFGFQVLEAMACGAPVICSNTTSLPEVVDDAALTCPPADIEGFALGLERVLNDSSQAETIRAAGIAQASRFSWERTARQLMRICEEAGG